MEKDLDVCRDAGKAMFPAELDFQFCNLLFREIAFLDEGDKLLIICLLGSRLGTICHDGREMMKFYKAIAHINMHSLVGCFSKIHPE